VFSQTIIAGNLGGDPDLRYTPQGDAVCNFSVACNRKWKGQDGQGQEETVWFRVTVWGKQAEVCNQYLTKGRQVMVVGRLVPDKATGGPRIWTDNNGNARSSFELRGLDVKFMGGAATGAERPTGQSGQSGPPDHVAEDEIPF